MYRCHVCRQIDDIEHDHKAVGTLSPDEARAHWLAMAEGESNAPQSGQ